MNQLVKLGLLPVHLLPDLLKLYEINRRLFHSIDDQIATCFSQNIIHKEKRLRQIEQGENRKLDRKRKREAAIKLKAEKVQKAEKLKAINCGSSIAQDSA